MLERTVFINSSPALGIAFPGGTRDNLHMNGLELRHLRVICAVADAGSLSKASAQLGVSQPALTAQVQRLERRIGGLLFARTGTGVVPTELGAYVVAVGRHVLSDVDGLLAGIRQRTAVSTSGVIRLGGMPGPIVPMLAGEIAERRSGVDVSIKIAPPTDLVTMLADQQLDFV